MTLEVEFEYGVYRGEEVESFKFNLPQKIGSIAVPRFSSDLKPFMNMHTWRVKCENVTRTLGPSGVVYAGVLVGKNGEKAKFFLFAS